MTCQITLKHADYCIKSSHCYSLQLDESTDVTPNLLVYVKYEYDGAAKEDFLFCQSLEARTSTYFSY